MFRSQGAHKNLYIKLNMYIHNIPNSLWENILRLHDLITNKYDKTFITINKVKGNYEEFFYEHRSITSLPSLHVQPTPM